MKTNKILAILIPVAAVLVSGICIAVFFLVSDQNKEEKYYAQMRSARQYLSAGDYEQVAAAYLAAIELKPEDPEAYEDLARLYMEQEQYVQASEITRKAYEKTGDQRFEWLIDEIKLLRQERGGANDSAVPAVSGMTGAAQPQTVAAGEDSPNLTLRGATVDMVADYCYQEYVDNFGAANISFVSDGEGYSARFGGFNGLAYFKNTGDHKDIFDDRTRVPRKDVRPYKVVLGAPSVLFVGYGGYISYDRLCRMFGTDAAPDYDGQLDIYCMSFTFRDCQMLIETDAAGNVCKEDPLLVLSPLELVKADWVEETAPEETEEEFFVLGSHRYSYDVTSIAIYGESIEDLSPLTDCRYLEELILEDCRLSGLDGLEGCGSLRILGLRGTEGFSDLTPLSGLTALRYLDLHGCSQVSDISPVMGLALELLHTCETGVTFEQTMAYKEAHPDCEVWYDNHPIS